MSIQVVQVFGSELICLGDKTAYIPFIDDVLFTLRYSNVSGVPQLQEVIVSQADELQQPSRFEAVCKMTETLKVNNGNGSVSLNITLEAHTDSKSAAPECRQILRFVS